MIEEQNIPLDTMRYENDKKEWMVFDFLSGCHPFFLKIQ